MVAHFIGSGHETLWLKRQIKQTKENKILMKNGFHTKKRSRESASNEHSDQGVNTIENDAPNRPFISKEMDHWMKIYFCENIRNICRRLCCNDSVLHAAVIFFRRVYAHTEVIGFASLEPMLVATTCICLAHKIQEANLNVGDVVSRAKEVLVDQRFAWCIDDVVRMEAVLLILMEFNVCIFHPRTELFSFLLDANVSENEIWRKCGHRLNDALCWSDVGLDFHPAALAITIFWITIKEYESSAVIHEWLIEHEFDIKLLKSIEALLKTSAKDALTTGTRMAEIFSLIQQLSTYFLSANRLDNVLGGICAHQTASQTVES